MLLRCLVLLFCLTAICAQKGGRQASASDSRPIQQSPSRIWAGRKVPQASEPIVQQAEEPDREPEEDREVEVAARLPPPQRPRPQLPPPPPPSREGAESDPGGHPAPEPYSFSYSVDDPETGAATSREESQDINGEIVGFYHLRDADGRMRRVDYTAGKDGFKANIRSNEEGLSATAPADVNVELSASPSISRPAYAPNNRPAASESSIRSLASGRYIQRLTPAAFAPLPARSAPVPIAYTPLPARSHVVYAPLPAPIAPLPAPPTQETRRIEQVVEQRAEDPAEEAQISQQYETSEPSDPQEFVQQRNVDIEEAFESAPAQPQPVKGGRISAPAPQLPIGRFTPSFQSYSSITQVKDNTIQDPKPSASTKSAPISPPVSYQTLRPLAPVVPLSRPQLIQFDQRVQASTVPNLAPISPISNNIVLQEQPITQQRLLNYLVPNQQAWFTQQTPQIQVSPQVIEPLELAYPYMQQFQSIQSKPIPSAYNLVVNHRETQLTQTPRQPVVQTQVRELVAPPPPAPRPLPQIQSNSFEYKPLPTLISAPRPQPIQRVEQTFEPQTYESIQQTYEPLQQEAEDPAEESRVEPPCNCDDQIAESAPVKGLTAPTEPQPVKSGRVSPARAFIPQAFRS